MVKGKMIAVKQLAESWQPLFEPGQIVELRAIGVKQRSGAPCIIAGFFDQEHLEQMAAEALELTESAKGVYATLNPLKPEIIARRFNRVDRATTDELAKDADVLRRTRLLIDVDPTRDPRISATDDEKEISLDTIERIEAWLTESGWPEPIRSDSGNGYHRLYRIDLPAEDDGLVKRCLAALAQQYNTAAAKVDQTVFNQSRISKLPGTWARKGDSTGARPHRQAKLLHVPEQFLIVPREKLEALAGLAKDEGDKSKSTNTNSTRTRTATSANGAVNHRLKVEDWLRDRRVEFTQKPGKHEGKTVWALKECPFDSAHGKDAAVMQDDDGKLYFHCFHDGCVHNGWKQCKEKIGAPGPEHFDPPYATHRSENKGSDNTSQRQTPHPDQAPTASPEPRKPAFAPRLYTWGEFARADFRRDWLVRNVLVRNQPAVGGGPKKVLKSGLAIDLAVSVGSGTPFLGYERFAVRERCNVLLLNGESGEATVQETASRIARARGVTDEPQIVFGTDLPQLASIEHLQDLEEILSQRQIGLFILDPSYLCLLAGFGRDGPQAANLFEMGAVYRTFANYCLKAGATPLLCAHARKSRTSEPPDLDDLAFAGIAEFARQWILLSRRELYENDGKHKLWLSIGGSAGHSFLGHLDIDEGLMNEDFTGRKWGVTVTPFGEAAKERKRDRDEAKATERSADEFAVMKLIDNMTAKKEVATLSRLRKASIISRLRTDAALERCRQQELIEEYTATVPKGNKATQDATAYRRCDD